MTCSSRTGLARALIDLLALENPPLAIGFSSVPPPGVDAFHAVRPAPMADGRSGSVAAGCVFWSLAQERTFVTVAEDHANCSVGSLTHGLRSLDEVAGCSDIAALVESDWVSPEMFPSIPTVSGRPRFVSYGPLEQVSFEPDVVFLRINAKQAMMLSDALPELRFEGKPQCHIIPIARERQVPAISVGCMLSRVRTGMPNTQMTCALPAAKLAVLVDRLQAARAADHAVAAYASEDARRFTDSRL